MSICCRWSLVGWRKADLSSTEYRLSAGVGGRVGKKVRISICLLACTSDIAWYLQRNVVASECRRGFSSLGMSARYRPGCEIRILSYSRSVEFV